MEATGARRLRSESPGELERRSTGYDEHALVRVSPQAAEEGDARPRRRRRRRHAHIYTGKPWLLCWPVRGEAGVRTRYAYPPSCVPCVPSTVARHSVARQTVARLVRARVRLLRLASYHPQAMHNDLLNRALKRGMKVG